MAQLVEQRIRNAWVAGSSPAIGSLTFRSQNQHEDASSDSFFRNSRAVGNPINTQSGGISSVGRALASQAEGRGFESRIPLKIPHKHNKYAP